MDKITISMNMGDVKATMSMFFNRDAVMNSVNKVTLKALREGGAYVMLTARRLLVNAKRQAQEVNANENLTAEQKAKKLARIEKPNAPPKPPKSRTGLLRDFLFFAYDRSIDGVVVGPAKIAGKADSPTVPQLLEEGGEFMGRRFEPTGEWRTVAGEHQMKMRAVPDRKTMSARPYMSTALNKPAVKAKLDKIWADSIRA